MASIHPSQPNGGTRMAHDIDVAKMALYGLDRAHKVLAALTASGKSVWTPADTASFDCMHYLGDEAVAHAAAELGVQPGNIVVDLGAGFGATGRYLAAQYGVNVVAVELQPGIAALAREILARSGPEVMGRMRVLEGDFLTLPVQATSDDGLPPQFHHLISLLCIMHIPLRAELFTRIHSLLLPGGSIYIEDFYARTGAPDAATAQVLRDVVSCQHLPDETEYRRDLEQAGLEVIRWQDVSEEWGEFVHRRAQAYRAGSEVEGNLAGFYDAVDELFAGGQVGGCRITARKRTG